VYERIGAEAEFVAGSRANSVFSNELMDSLGFDSFAATQRNAVRDEGNTDPRRLSPTSGGEGKHDGV
jgi:hypothetical protein